MKVSVVPAVTGCALQVWTDGACRGNPGAGGWGAVIVRDGAGGAVELSGGAAETTNNRMELEAVIRALEWAPQDAHITLYTDSKYVCDGCTQWLPNWKRRGWRTSTRKPVLNQDLWQALDALLQGRHIVWQWVKGHSDNAGNIRADALAVAAIPR